MPPDLRLHIQDASNHDHLPCRRTLRRWVMAALRKRAEVTLRFVGRAEGRRLNHQFRGKNYATNVLTFTYSEHSPLLGDIVLCVPILKREAVERDIPLRRHCAHLVVHGTLHMQGYDHERDAQARVMEALEAKIMRNLGYPDPYLLST